MKGDCFSVAANAVTRDRELVLCHGRPINAATGERYWHAWVEQTQTVKHPDWPIAIDHVTCIDRSNGLDASLPQAWFYKLGQLESDDVRRYTAEQAITNLLDFGHYGPWPEGDSGPN